MRFKLLLILVIVFLFLNELVLVTAQSNDVNNISGANNLGIKFKEPGEFIYQIYIFSLSIGGVLAFGAIVYGGILRIAGAGNPSKISEANEWIKSALIGLLLLFGVYFVLTIINPNLVNLNLPQLKKIETSTSSLTTSSVSDNKCARSSKKLSEAEARNMIERAGIKINAKPPQTTLTGINIETIQTVILLKSRCNCYIKITGGTEHGGWNETCGHRNGYKVDISLYKEDERGNRVKNSELEDFLKKNGFKITRNYEGRIETGYQWENMKIYHETRPGKEHWDAVVFPRS